MGWRDMLPGNAKDFKENIDKKTIVVLIVGILIGVAYVNGIPLSYSKVEFAENYYQHFEVTKMKLPILKTSITVKFMHTDNDVVKDDYAQQCASIGSFAGFIESLIFMDSNGEVIWSEDNLDYYGWEGEYRTGDPNIDIDEGTSNEDSSCSTYGSVLSIKIKMNGNPVKVQSGLSVRTF